ncbi:related to cyclin-like protein CLG1 [Rhynchosporium agropyri]|uniref:Related to cyclin-like protein CLG1 n=1 Tax=Rhynchosporium agropyri TaxID=914238 RepID=A0A1E1L126_9HELO|nr:related to cyclin-like protein CLG1 [Rhynchosporium agropyri]
MYRTAERPAPLNFPLPCPLPTYNIDKRKEFRQPQFLAQLPPTYLEAPVREGLRTPPTDGMATAYQNNSYSHGFPSRGRSFEYHPVEGTQNHYGGAYNNEGHGHSRQYMAIPQPPPTSTSTLRNEIQEPIATSQPQSPEPAQRTSCLSHQNPSQRKSTTDTIRVGTQIPKTISSNGGSLAEFAAQIACLFWFESTETLEKSEKELPPSATVKRLEKEASPSTGFRKWVVTILSTTQVTENVIILALLFIYRLKTSNPAVKGRSGSEYRLLTVALMLGNKFLDDNTYTNKTWAEVSGIAVGEIHVMEVEFLSNMRYSLLASKEQWADWHKKLRNIRNYCDRAAEVPIQISPQAYSTLHPNLPSPPASQTSPPTHPYLPPSSSFMDGHQWPANNSLPPISSPLSSLPEAEFKGYSRKRSYDGDAEEPVTKRITRPSTGPLQYTPAIPPLRQDARRLPVPDQTISTSQSMSHGYNTPTGMSQNPPVLPPLCQRTMPAVYAPSTPSSWTQIPVLTPNGHPTSGYSTSSRRHSPRSVQDLLSYGSSPTNANFPNHASPSVFLQQRSSPYKPIRHVNTLLYPPPSASMHDYSINTDHMHYQPLGKRHDYRSGVVPDYSHTPPNQWPVLRQPNFNP